MQGLLTGIMTGETQVGHSRLAVATLLQRWPVESVELQHSISSRSRIRDAEYPASVGSMDLARRNQQNSFVNPHSQLMEFDIFFEYIEDI